MFKNKTIICLFVLITIGFPITFLFYLSIAVNSPILYDTQTVTITETRVYITKYGDCYHSADCSYLYNSKIPMGKQQAINNGYSACSRCGGYSNDTIAVTYSKPVPFEEKYSLKNILITTTLTTLYTSLLYLLININHFSSIALYNKKRSRSKNVYNKRNS